ncbi:MAG: CopG family ribbon-helix-helix protein [Candidatus Saccharimonadales bacterium]
MSPNTSKRIFISAPADFLEHLDKAVLANYTTRSAFIREAVALKLAIDSQVESEFNDKSSVVNLVRNSHFQTIAKRNYNRDKATIDWRE